MATTKLMYKGIKKKVDLVRTLREKGCSDDSIATWTNQRLVQDLISSNLSRNPGKSLGWWRLWRNLRTRGSQSWILSYLERQSWILSNLERQFRLFKIWNDSPEYYQFWNDSFEHFKFGTTVLNIINFGTRVLIILCNFETTILNIYNLERQFWLFSI